MLDCFSVFTRRPASELEPADNRIVFNNLSILYSLYCVLPVYRQDHHRVLVKDLTMVQVDQEQCATAESQCSTLQVFNCF